MHADDRRQEHGQVLVLFALGAVAMILVVGLVLDGGSTYGQRRVQQNAADLAALAGANAWLLDTGDAAAKNAAAVTAARTVATQNGYSDGIDDVVVTVSPQAYGTAGAQTVKVDIGAKHANAFAGMVGMQTWDVFVTATAVTGRGGAPRGVAPILFAKSAFVNGSGDPLPQYANKLSPFTFGEANGDVPVSANDISWTVFASPANLNTNATRNIINGSDQLSRPVSFGDYIGQRNNGNHTALYSDVQQYLAGQTLTVPVADAAGNFQGWAMFHVVSADGGSSKTITGYFTSGFSEDLEVCMSSAACPVAYGGIRVLKLIN